MTSLTVTLERQSNLYRVRLSGAIDERADVDQLFAVLDHDTIFDMSSVVRMNSIGVQRWINHCREFTTSHRLVIEAASYPVVTQANCVANLFAGGSVESCLAPYFCSTCQTNLMALVRSDEVVDGPPAKTCLTCGSMLDFDELDTYFSFLSRRERCGHDDLEAGGRAATGGDCHRRGAPPAGGQTKKP
jgi:hypothetical protein